jgi:hypothetical protein
LIPAHLARLTWKLPRTSPLRPIAANVANGSNIESTDVDALLAILKSDSGRRWREQELAARIIPHLDLDAEIEIEVSARLVELLERRNWPDPGPNGLRLFTAFTAAAFAGRILVEIGWPSLVLEANAVILAGCCILFVPLLKHAMGRDDNGLLPVRCAAASTLSLSRVPGSIDGLAAAAVDEARGIWAHGRERLRQTALFGLPRVLPGLTDSHYGLLKRRTVPCLVRMRNCVLQSWKRWRK